MINMEIGDTFIYIYLLTALLYYDLLKIVRHPPY